MATISRDWPVMGGDDDVLLQQTGWHHALFVEAIADDWGRADALNG
jgi:hypothetical protein